MQVESNVLTKYNRQLLTSPNNEIMFNIHVYCHLDFKHFLFIGFVK